MRCSARIALLPVLLAAAASFAACAMQWEECVTNDDCPYPQVCMLGDCVLPADADLDGLDIADDGSHDGEPPDDDTGTDPFDDTADDPDDGRDSAGEEATCEGGCSSPETDCYESPGDCVDGTCVYDPKPAGEGCNDGDPCTDNDECDGSGNCKGDEMDCSRPHTTGGRCEDGSCTGFECVDPYGNCTPTWDDGCETSLTSSDNCGECGEECSAGEHASASCSTGTCRRSCTGSYENCDGDWGDGCEIPTGQTGTCDRFGLNSSSGCGTAYCGSSGSATAQNFGTWYCIGCSHCHEFGDGFAWCIGLTIGGDIQWSGDRCDTCCGSDDRDLVCGP